MSTTPTTTSCTLRPLGDATRNFSRRSATADAPATQQRADAAGIPFVTTQAGGMFGLYFSGADDIVTFDDVMSSDAGLFKRFFHLMLEGGVYLAPSAFEAGFTSIAHGDAELKLTLDAAERAFAALK